MGKLDNQVAIITGGGTGIGQGIAFALAAEGAKVVISGRRQEPLQATIAAVKSKGGEGLAVQADASVEADVDRLVKSAVDAYGTVHILVNNAGIGRLGHIHDHSIQDWDDVMAVNLRGPFLMARAVLPILRAKQHGYIVNMSSVAGIEHPEGFGAYCVAKHGLNALSALIQKENQEFGIHAHTVCPGMVVSELTDVFGDALDRSKCLVPEDIADLVLWLVTRRQNVKIPTPILIETMENPWCR